MDDIQDALSSLLASSLPSPAPPSASGVLWPKSHEHTQYTHRFLSPVFSTPPRSTRPAAPECAAALVSERSADPHGHHVHTPFCPYLNATPPLLPSTLPTPVATHTASRTPTRCATSARANTRNPMSIRLRAATRVYAGAGSAAASSRSSSASPHCSCVPTTTTSGSPRWPPPENISGGRVLTGAPAMLNVSTCRRSDSTAGRGAPSGGTGGTGAGAGASAGALELTELLRLVPRPKPAVDAANVPELLGSVAAPALRANTPRGL
eukprot:352178-Chlamydomonas_euryale.AAC.10